MNSDLALALLLSDDHNDDDGNIPTRRYESDDNSLIEIKSNKSFKKQSYYSPFSILDLLIYYFGTWSYRQHGKISNYIVSVIIFILLWQTLILDVIEIFETTKSFRFSLEIVMVICLYIRTIFRLYYFSRFAPVWMRKNSYFQDFEKNQNIYKTNLKISRLLVRISILIVSIIFIIKHIYKYYIDNNHCIGYNN